MLRDPSHLVPNMPWLLVACVNAHTSTHAPHNLKPQSGVWNLLCGWSTHGFHGENDNRRVFPRLGGRPVPAGVSACMTFICKCVCVCVCVYVCVLSSWVNLYLLCNPPYWDVSAPFCEYTDLPGRLIVLRLPKMNWQAKLQALLMSWLNLSDARHTVCLCLSPLRMRSGMPPMWTKTRPSTDGPTALRASQHVTGSDCVA